MALLASAIWISHVVLALPMLLGLTRGLSKITTQVHPCDDLPGDYDTWKSNSQNVGAVIVGGGVAGLSAALTLLDGNVTDFIVLEADDYLGGRVKTYREGSILVEDGAEWIHGGMKNPLYRLAKRMHAVSPNLKDKDYTQKFKTVDGESTKSSKLKVLKLVEKCRKEEVVQNYYNNSYGQCFLDRFNKFYGVGASGRLGRAWLHLLEQMVMYEEGWDSWLDGSARDSVRYADLGEDHQWLNGYDTLIDYLKVNIPRKYTKLSTPVCRIFWDDTDTNKVLVVTEGGQATYVADHVIVTTSVGHLKDRHLRLFRPRLSGNRIRDLRGIELGVAEKVQIGWCSPWWRSNKPLELYILWTKFDLPPEMEWMYGIVQVLSVHQQRSILEVFVTGHHATGMVNLPEETVRDHLVSLLSSVTNTKVPQPTFFRRTKWGSNPWTLGSYSSFVTVEGERAGIVSRTSFRMPLTNTNGKQVVLWGGEHTHDTHYSTVDGAMGSGQRVAGELLDLLSIETQTSTYSQNGF